MTEEATTTAEAAEPTAVVEIVSPNSIADLESKMKVKGTVKRIELYGAFVDIGVGTDAIIHISQLGNKRVNRVEDVINVGDEVEVWVDQVDVDRSQVTVSMVEPLAVDWSDLSAGQSYKGTVTRLENFGAFVDIGAEKEGLVHISEMSHDYIKHPSEVVTVGDEIDVQILSFKKRKRRINLSMKALQERPQSESVASQADVAAFDEAEEEGEMPTAMEIALRRAMGDDNAARPRDGRGGRRGKRKRRRLQDDILNRTLNMANEK